MLIYIYMEFCKWKQLYSEDAPNTDWRLNMKINMETKMNATEDPNSICNICLSHVDEQQKNAFIVLNNHLFDFYQDGYVFFACNCNVKIHDTCVKKWLQYHKKCPICHTAAYKCVFFIQNPIIIKWFHTAHVLYVKNHIALQNIPLFHKICYFAEICMKICTTVCCSFTFIICLNIYMYTLHSFGYVWLINNILLLCIDIMFLKFVYSKIHI